jgi:hypothetical protein
MEFVAFLRDLVIIVVGLVWIGAGILFAIVTWLAWKFVRSLPGRTETVTTPARELVGQARQALGSAGEGAHTAREAIAFVSEKAVVPTIGFVSAAVAARRFVSVLVAGVRRDESSEAA